MFLCQRIQVPRWVFRDDGYGNGEERWLALTHLHELEQLRDALDSRGTREASLKAKILELWPALSNLLLKRRPADPKARPASGTSVGDDGAGGGCEDQEGGGSEDEGEGRSELRMAKRAKVRSEEVRRSTRVREEVKTLVMEQEEEEMRGRGARAETVPARASAPLPSGYRPMVEPWRHASLSALPESVEGPLAALKLELEALGDATVQTPRLLLCAHLALATAQFPVWTSSLSPTH